MDVLQSGITIRHEFFFSKSTQVGISSKQTAKVLMNYCIWIYIYIYIYIHDCDMRSCGLSCFYHSWVIHYAVYCAIYSILCDCVGERGLGQHRCFVGGNFCGEALLQRTETATRLDLVRFGFTASKMCLHSSSLPVH